MKGNPDMDKSAVWAGTGCMAVLPISGLRYIFPLCSLVDSEKKHFKPSTAKILITSPCVLPQRLYCQV